MGFFDRLLGRSPDPYAGGGRHGAPTLGGYGMSSRGGAVRGGRSRDEQAIARYRYLLETAPPERLEEAHAEAFAQLTPEQRRQVLTELAHAGGERVADDSPRSLARAATRLEMRRPGSLVSVFGARPGMMGVGMGGVGMGMGGMLLSSVAGAVIGTSIAHEMFDDDGFMDWDTDGDAGESFADGGGDYAAQESDGDFFGGDAVGDFGGDDFGF